MVKPGISVIIDYTNWRGERREREIIPFDLVFENNEWHHDTQWLLQAFDLDDEKRTLKTFAMKDIHAWRPKAGQ